jgi:hypothetical protein
MGEAIAARLSDKAHPYDDIHLTYDGAGDLISHPYSPTALGQYGLGLFGGTAATSATACTESWHEVSEFLSANL